MGHPALFGRFSAFLGFNSFPLNILQKKGGRGRGYPGFPGVPSFVLSHPSLEKSEGWGTRPFLGRFSAFLGFNSFPSKILRKKGGGGGGTTVPRSSEFRGLPPFARKKRRIGHPVPGTRIAQPKRDPCFRLLLPFCLNRSKFPATPRDYSQLTGRATAPLPKAQKNCTFTTSGAMQWECYVVLMRSSWLFLRMRDRVFRRCADGLEFLE